MIDNNSIKLDEIKKERNKNRIFEDEQKDMNIYLKNRYIFDKIISNTLYNEDLITSLNKLSINDNKNENIKYNNIKKSTNSIDEIIKKYTNNNIFNNYNDKIINVDNNIDIYKKYTLNESLHLNKADNLKKD